MKSLRLVLYLILTLCLSPALGNAQQAPPVPKPLAERVNLATHVFVGRAQRVRLRKLVGGKLRKVKPVPDHTDYTSDVVFEIEVIVDEVLFPGKWKPSATIKLIYGGGMFSVSDTRKTLLGEKLVYLTRIVSFGGQAYFSASYGWNLVETFSKKGEVEALLNQRVAR